jgi:hypothetical protein
MKNFSFHFKDRRRPKIKIVGSCGWRPSEAEAGANQPGITKPRFPVNNDKY